MKGGKRAGLGLAVAHDAGGNQAGVIGDGTERVRERIAKARRPR